MLNRTGVVSSLLRRLCSSSSSSSRSRSNSNSSFRRPLSLSHSLLSLSQRWWKEQHLLEARILGQRALTACVRRVILLLNAFRLLTKRAR